MLFWLLDLQPTAAEATVTVRTRISTASLTRNTVRFGKVVQITAYIHVGVILYFAARWFAVQLA